MIIISGALMYFICFVFSFLIFNSLSKTDIIAETELKPITYSNGQMNEYHEIFSLSDHHSTNRIDLNELGLIIRSIGLIPSENGNKTTLTRI